MNVQPKHSPIPVNRFEDAQRHSSDEKDIAALRLATHGSVRNGSRFRKVDRAMKRLLDIGIATVGLIIASPIILVAAAAVVITSPGSPLFAQIRVGRDGRHFRMYKLRTMVKNAHLMTQPLHLKDNRDPRILRVGKLLRASSVDELPNLFNVIKGEMSLVGPRPMLASELAYCVEQHGASALRTRHIVRPGVTGLWQISGRALLHIDQRVALDVKYASSWSVVGDVKILLRTIPALLSRKGAF